MSKGDVINFMQTYQRITQNMFKNMPKYASIILNLNSNHQIKTAVYKLEMKKIFIIVIASILYFSNAFAVTLLDALNQTYKNNIQLNAERENIKVSEEDVNIAKADYKPSLTLKGSKSIEEYK